MQEQPDLLKLPKRTTVMQLIHEVHEVQVHAVQVLVHEVQVHEVHVVQVKVLYACVLSELLRVTTCGGPHVAVGL